MHNSECVGNPLGLRPLSLYNFNGDNKLLKDMCVLKSYLRNWVCDPDCVNW